MTEVEILKTACLAVIEREPMNSASKLPVLEYLIALKKDAEKAEKAKRTVDEQLYSIDKENGNA